MNSPDIWIGLRALPSPATIDPRKQRALQAAYREFAQLGLNIRNGAMNSWASNLGLPGDWPLVEIDEDVMRHWEPSSVVLEGSAVHSAAANAVEGWERRLIKAAGQLMEAGLSVVAVGPRKRRVLTESEGMRQWIELVIDPASPRASARSPLQAAA